MATSFKRVLTATFTNSATGATVTLTGDQAYSFRRQFLAAEPIITVYKEGSPSEEDSYNIDCICDLKYTNAKGEDYVKPECESIFCPEPAEEVLP